MLTVDIDTGGTMTDALISDGERRHSFRVYDKALGERSSDLPPVNEITDDPENRDPISGFPVFNPKRV